MKARTGGGKGRHLQPRLVQKIVEGKTSYELNGKANVMIIYIATALPEHVLACITRKVTRPENDMDLVLASKLTWLMCWWWE